MSQSTLFGYKQKWDKHKFPYQWTLKDAVFTKDKGEVFSCFSCGGGSTMGYKLAGFDVIGCNEIDPKMMACYIENHHPKYSFLESIETLKLHEDLPIELYNLDILDGSPPCSTFSMSGQREKNWGKEKKFREGQQYQILDELFFHFIDLAEKLKPKVIIAENVKGLIFGNAVKYVHGIYKAFDKAGYTCQHFLLDASKMGVPQRRERVFFIALRKDLANGEHKPKLNLKFNEKEISYKDFRMDSGNKSALLKDGNIKKYWALCKPGNSFSTVHPKGSFFNEIKLHPDRSLPTIRSSSFPYDFIDARRLYNKEGCMAGSFPTDYKFHNVTPHYLIGMSVPPIMTAQIATRIYDQWLSKL